MKRSRMGTLVVSTFALALASCSGSGKGPDATGGDGISVGVLHSLTGTMAISEITVKNAEMLAIEEINAAGGVLGKKIIPLVEDGASDPSTFAQKASKLIESDKVVTVFGGWTSASRKAMLPVFERNNNLLWYPVQFEGNECSANIMYSGAQPNQQALPALQWAIQQGHKSFFLVGSDYVYPRTANLVLKKHIEKDGFKVLGESYVPLGGTDFSGVIGKIQQAKPSIIINTLNGDSNVAFFKQLQASGISPKTLPVISFSIGEQEAKAMGPSLVEGSYAAWNYFQSLTGDANTKFVEAYRKVYGADAAITDPMVHAYLDVYAWKAAAEKAKSVDSTAVRQAAITMGDFSTPMGNVRFAGNQSLVQKAYIGKLKSDGQFEIVSDSGLDIQPEPYDPLAFPGKSCKH